MQPATSLCNSPFYIGEQTSTAIWLTRTSTFDHFMAQPDSGTVTVPLIDGVEHERLVARQLTDETAPRFLYTAGQILGEVKDLEQKTTDQFLSQPHIDRKRVSALAIPMHYDRSLPLFPRLWRVTYQGFDPSWGVKSHNFKSIDGKIVRFHITKEGEPFQFSVGKESKCCDLRTEQAMRINPDGTVETRGYTFNLRNSYATGLINYLGITNPSAETVTSSLIHFIMNSNQLIPDEMATTVNAQALGLPHLSLLPQNSHSMDMIGARLYLLVTSSILEKPGDNPPWWINVSIRRLPQAPALIPLNNKLVETLWTWPVVKQSRRSE